MFWPDSLLASGGGDIPSAFFRSKSCSSSPLMTRRQLAGRFATAVSYSRVIRARITWSVSSGYKGTLKQAQPKRARWTRPSASASRRRAACPQRAQRRGSSFPTPTPKTANRVHLGFQRFHA
jgi:hypothetical protein